MSISDFSAAIWRAFWYNFTDPGVWGLLAVAAVITGCIVLIFHQRFASALRMWATVGAVIILIAMLLAVGRALGLMGTGWAGRALTWLLRVIQAPVA